jgi:DNA-binding transcriptional LysR family regulator
MEAHAPKANIVATASTTEMVRSLVGAGVGCSILNMQPATSMSYAGDELRAIPFAEETQSLRLVIGNTGGKQRRLLEVFTEACRSYFSTGLAKQFVVVSPPSDTGR